MFTAMLSYVFFREASYCVRTLLLISQKAGQLALTSAFYGVDTLTYRRVF